MTAAARAGRCWYRPENHRRVHTQIAAQRWIAELAETRQITRGAKLVLDELAKHVDAKGTTQKSIAFLAKRCAVSERTVQRYLRALCPSKAKNPEAWATRVVTRRFIHALPEPGRKADNVPSWFTLEIPDRFFAPKAPQAPVRPTPVAKKVSPGGAQIVTQAVILGSSSSQKTVTLHPCSPLAPSSGGSEASREHEPPERSHPTPRPPPAGGEAPELAVTLCSRLFPSHAPIAHRAVARLAALGWTEAQIVAFLRKAARDPNLGPDRARHPLLTAVWLAEREFRTAPREPVETPPPSTHEPPERTDAPNVPAELRARIERARAALAAGEAKAAASRRVKALDPPNATGGGDEDDPNRERNDR